ncbi:MAG TPA: ATP synthase subunit I [Erysipelotrichaceae bacterium]|nr:ATP synthase subunit I [Erysipelotrichaceae bacterium]HQB31716.1 ATP synthase subunit I [Erysipelotrichaceae bacterium]
MDKRIRGLSVSITIVLSIIFAFINKAISAGMILGCLASMTYIHLLTVNMDETINKQQSSGKMVISKLFRLSIIIISMLIAMVIPEKVNIFGVFFGLMIFKLSLLFLAIKRKEGE